MDKLEFQKYLETKKKLTKEFKNIDELEKKYNKVKESKEKLNQYQKAYHKEMMQNDPAYVEKRKEFNRKSYEKYKEKHPYISKRECKSCLDNKQQETKPTQPEPETKEPSQPKQQQKITLDNFRNDFLGF
jgi:hypothetical protein